MLIESGGNVLHAVAAAISKATADPDFDEFWCVCDIDDTSKEDLNAAVSLANQHNIFLCTSNRSFEIWLALHWEPHISLAPVMNETEAVALVRKHFPKYNRKNKSVPFAELLPRTAEACKNAGWLDRQGVSNPSTKVHELILSLTRSKKTRGRSK